MSEVKTDSVVNVSGDNDSGIDLSTNDVVAIKTADTERARVDASGNVLVGTTDTVPSNNGASGDAGAAISPDGVFRAARSGNVALDINRMDSDGEIAAFRKDGSTVGTLNSNGGAFIMKGTSTSAPVQMQTHDGNEDIEVDPDGFIKFETAGSERMRIDSSGHLLVGQTSVSTPGQGNTTEGGSFRGDGRVFLSANGTYSLGLNRSDSGELTNFSRQGVFKGSINISTSAVSYNTSSDHRLKENVADMTGAIARVKQLAPKRFNFIADPDDTTVDGFLAHEAQTVVPEAVTGTHNEVDDDGNAVMQGIDQAKLVPLLTGALQEAIAKIETLETKVTALENA